MKTEQTKTIKLSRGDIEDMIYEGVEKRLNYSSRPVCAGEIVRERSPLTFPSGFLTTGGTIAVNSLPEEKPPETEIVPGRAVPAQEAE